MKKYRWLIILLIVALVGGGAWYWISKKEEVVVTPVTEKPHYGDIANSVTSTGTIEPVDTVVVGSQISGIIQYIYADFNTKVKKGQLIAQIDKTILQAQLEQIEANLATAKSDLQYQQSNYHRQDTLLKVGAISKAAFETALDSYNDAKAQVDNLQSQIKAATKNLSYTSIFSPIDGTVLSRNVSVGQTVAASFNTPTLFVIANDLTKMQVQASVDEADIGNVKTGLRVTFTVDAFAKDVFNGTVNQVRLEPTVSSNVVTYTTIISTPNLDLKLKPGMTANVTIYTKEDSNAMLLPVKALKFMPDASLEKNYVIIPDTTLEKATTSTGTKTHSAKDTSSKKTGGVKHGTSASVWVLSGKNLIQKKIRTGMNDDANVEILSGLSADDEVVTGEDAPASTKKASATTVRSPFMPQMGGAKKPASTK
jgi:HlyD family secretion protein